MRSFFSLFLILFANIHTDIYGFDDGRLSPADTAGWELRKDKHGIKVWTRDQKEAGLLEYLAVTTIETNLERLVEIIYDVDNYPSWTANCASASIYKALSDTSHIEYLTTDVPWPLEDRDVAMEFIRRQYTDDYFEVRLRSVADAVPRSEDHVRIEISEGNWIFRKIDSDRVEVIHQFLSDPGGNIPMWIVNMFIVSGPYKTLNNLKALCGDGD